MCLLRVLARETEEASVNHDIAALFKLLDKVLVDTWEIGKSKQEQARAALREIAKEWPRVYESRAILKVLGDENGL